MSEKNKTAKKLTASVVAVIILAVCLCITTFALVYSTVAVDNNLFQTGEIKIDLKYKGSRFFPYHETITVHFGAFVSTPCVRAISDDNSFNAETYLVNAFIELEERLL